MEIAPRRGKPHSRTPLSTPPLLVCIDLLEFWAELAMQVLPSAMAARLGAQGVELTD